MQRSQYLYDTLLKEKKVIYFCKFTFNPKIIFLFRLPILWTLFSCMSANHYHNAGAVCAGNRNWFSRYRASQCSSGWIHQAGSPAACQDPKLACKLDGSSVAEKRSQAWKSKRKEKSSAEKDGKYCSPGRSPAMLPRLCIANRRFSAGLQGRRMGGLCVLSLWHPCYYCHMQMADTRHDRGNWGFGVVLY